MKVTSRTYLLGCALAAGTGSVPTLAGAQAQTPAKTYVITTIAQSAAGNVVAHEVLSLQRDSNGSRLAVASADGTIVSIPITFTAHGQIASNAQNGAVTCYNMAMDVLARAEQPAGEPASVYVQFGTAVVHIPLSVRATQTRGSRRELALNGASAGVFSSGGTAVDAGILIDATVEKDADVLRGATFEERHYLGTPAHVIARSTCVLQRAEQHTTTPVEI